MAGLACLKNYEKVDLIMSVDSHDELASTLHMIKYMAELLGTWEICGSSGLIMIGKASPSCNDLPPRNLLQWPWRARLLADHLLEINHGKVLLQPVAWEATGDDVAEGVMSQVVVDPVQCIEWVTRLSAVATVETGLQEEKLELLLLSFFDGFAVVGS